jgi:hypothetical protein
VRAARTIEPCFALHPNGNRARLDLPRNKPGRGAVKLPRPDHVKDLRRIATDGVAGRLALFWRATAPAVGEKGHPGKVGPSVGINLPKVVSLSPHRDADWLTHRAAASKQVGLETSFIIGHSTMLVDRIWVASEEKTHAKPLDGQVQPQPLV